jgi:hypothetical protein
MSLSASLSIKRQGNLAPVDWLLVQVILGWLTMSDKSLLHSCWLRRCRA